MSRTDATHKHQTTGKNETTPRSWWTRRDGFVAYLAPAAIAGYAVLVLILMRQPHAGGAELGITAAVGLLLGVGVKGLRDRGVLLKLRPMLWVGLVLGFVLVWLFLPAR